MKDFRIIEAPPDAFAFAHPTAAPYVKAGRTKPSRHAHIPIPINHFLTYRAAQGHEQGPWLGLADADRVRPRRRGVGYGRFNAPAKQQQQRRDRRRQRQQQPR